MKKSKHMALLLLGSILLTGCSEESKEIGNETTPEIEEGYSWEHESISFTIDALPQDTVDLLEEEAEYFESPSCALVGTDQIYTYDNYVVTFSIADDYEGLTLLTFKNDLVSTDEGICIGNSKDDVINTYGAGNEEIENVISYTKEGTQLRFILEDDIIISIELSKEYQ